MQSRRDGRSLWIDPEKLEASSHDQLRLRKQILGKQDPYLAVVEPAAQALQPLPISRVLDQARNRSQSFAKIERAVETIDRAAVVELSK